MEAQMKSTLAIIGATSLAIASPVIAQSDLVSRYAHWEQRLRDRVNDMLSYPEGVGGAAGDVFVSFRVGADGKPSDITVAQSSGNPVFDKAAFILVSRLGHIGRVPSANPQVGRIVLKLSYGDPTPTAAGSMRLARKDRQEQLSNQQRDMALITASTRVAQNH
jgi:TonB family protein